MSVRSANYASTVRSDFGEIPSDLYINWSFTLCNFNTQNVLKLVVCSMKKIQRNTQQHPKLSFLMFYKKNNLFHVRWLQLYLKRIDPCDSPNLAAFAQHKRRVKKVIKDEKNMNYWILCASCGLCMGWGEERTRRARDLFLQESTTCSCRVAWGQHVTWGSLHMTPYFSSNQYMEETSLVIL